MARLPAKDTGRPPEFLIIGAQRSGTTSLFDALMQHSQVSAPPMRELHYFDLNYWRGWRWYLRRFDRPANMISGESSPYYLYHPAAPVRVGRDLPGVRIIVLIRDPIERAWSQHQLNRSTGRDVLDFVQAIESEPERIEGLRPPRRAKRQRPHRDYSYAARGDYVRQLDRWCRSVDRESMLLVRSADLFKHPEEVHQRVQAHIGLPAENLPKPHRHRSEDRLDLDVRQAVAPYFSYSEDELRERYGIDYG